jgi:hypothetical protein
MTAKQTPCFAVILSSYSDISMCIFAAKMKLKGWSQNGVGIEFTISREQGICFYIYAYIFAPLHSAK